MNEHQLAITETTTTGREELQNPDGLIHYWTLMQLTLQRATTAREAIEVMTSLVEEHGYQSTAESFSIADPDEVWLMEMIGTGPAGKGAIWVAHADPRRLHLRLRQRTPNPGVSPRRSGELPLLGERHLLRHRTGLLRPLGGEPFSFADAYDDPDGAVAPVHRDPRLEHLPPRRAIRRARPRLPPRCRRRRALPPVDQARAEAQRRRRHGADARPLRGHPTTT